MLLKILILMSDNPCESVSTLFISVDFFSNYSNSIDFFSLNINILIYYLNDYVVLNYLFII